MAIQLNRDESIVAEEAVSSLSEAINRLEWLDRADFYDEAMKRREAEAIRKHIDATARTLSRIGV